MQNIKTIVTATEAITEAGISMNTVNITNAEKQISMQTGKVVSNVASRYDIKSMVADDEREQSYAFEHIRNLMLQLVAASLLISHYGTQTNGEDNGGYDKYKQALAELEMIRDGKVRLLDSNGNEYRQLSLSANHNIASAPRRRNAARSARSDFSKSQKR